MEDDAVLLRQCLPDGLRPHPEQRRIGGRYFQFVEKRFRLPHRHAAKHVHADLTDDAAGQIAEVGLVGNAMPHAPELQQRLLHGILGIVVAIFFAICGMWRLARFNVNASVVHGYFMGLAIPAGGNIVAMTTLLFVELGVDPMAFGIAYPIVMAFVGWLMVSHVHYPNFKGDGAEPIYLISKIVTLALFLAILWLGHASLLAALAVALFSTYAVLGIVNSLLASFAKKG